VIAGGYDDAETAFTSVAARKFASPSCQQLRALSSRFSGSGCPEAEGTRLSGERVITRADSFHSASTSTSRRTRPLISFGIWKSGVRSQKSEWRRRRLISSQREQNSRCDPYNGSYAFSRTAPRKSGPCGAAEVRSRGSQKLRAERWVLYFSSMADGLSERYRDLLTGSYDCVDRIV